MATYETRYSDGRVETHGTYAEAVAAFAAEHEGCEIGHDGDLQDGGERTLCWASEEDSIDDDGARATASIYRIGDWRDDPEEVEIARCDYLNDLAKDDALTEDRG